MGGRNVAVAKNKKENLKIKNSLKDNRRQLIKES